MSDIRWRVVLELQGGFSDAHSARMEAFRLYGGLVDRVMSQVSDEIGESEERTARRDRARGIRDSDAEEEM